MVGVQRLDWEVILLQGQEGGVIASQECVWPQGQEKVHPRFRNVLDPGQKDVQSQPKGC